MYAGQVQHPVFVALEGTARNYDLADRSFSPI